MFGCTQEAKINAYIRHLFDPTSNKLVHCGHPILFMILIYWRQYKIGLLAGSKVSGIHQLTSGLNLLLLVLRSWGGLSLKYAVFIFPSGLFTVSYIKPLP